LKTNRLLWTRLCYAAVDQLLECQGLTKALPEFFLHEMKVTQEDRPGFDKNPDKFVEHWLQPYTQHLSFMLSALHGTSKEVQKYTQL
jgi:hypothetical protein